jgi:membrane protease YdiL (CAAX protease family)
VSGGTTVEKFRGDPHLPSLRERWVELAVFLLLVVPSILLSLFAVRQNSVDFFLIATGTIFRDLGLLGLVLFFFWRNGEPLATLGWDFRYAGREIALGFVLFLPFTFVASALESLLNLIGISSASSEGAFLTPGPGLKEAALALVLVVVVAFTEESVFRGYLIKRFSAVTKSTGVAIVLSSFIFSLGHGYEGTAGVVTVGFMGVLLSLAYLWRGSLVAPITIHFLQNFLGIVLLPYLGYCIRM